jgi:high-affinity iron transporter
VVYLDSTSPAPNASAAAGIVDQVNLEFVPRVQVVRLGAAVVFKNSDREMHNINSQSACCNFNYAVPPGKESVVRPTRSGVMHLLCNIHQHMRGYVVVSPTDYFATADAEGRFRLARVPDGRHRLVVWQEQCEPTVTDVDVQGDTRAEVELKPLQGAGGGATSAAARPLLVRWTEAVRRIETTLQSGRDAASRGQAEAAERLALDAYFQHFEATQLETAVRLYRGGARAFQLERMFAKMRTSFADLAKGQVAAAAIDTAIAGLVTAVNQDVAELHRRQIFDPSQLATTTPSGAVAAASAPPRGPTAPDDVDRVLRELSAGFERVQQRLADRGGLAAASALADVYFDTFEQIEPALAGRDFSGVTRLETRFQDLRTQLGAGIPLRTARDELLRLYADIELACGPLRAGAASPAVLLTNAFIIVTREGVEALLIVSALLMYLIKSGQRERVRAIWGGIGLAVAATLVTWLGLQWVVTRSGMAREFVEGVVALLAAAVLFYVSYWLISKAQAQRWQEFLNRQVARGAAAGSGLALAAAAFLAVYREGAETVLFFQALLADAGPQAMASVLAGIGLGMATLVAIYGALRFATFRMAIRPFFRVTGALLFALAVVFAGQGTRELQEAGVLQSAPLLTEQFRWLLDHAPQLHAVLGSLGVYPTTQSLAIQAVLLAGAAAALLVSLWPQEEAVKATVTGPPVREPEPAVPA